MKTSRKGTETVAQALELVRSSRLPRRGLDSHGKPVGPSALIRPALDEVFPELVRLADMGVSEHRGP